MVESKIEGLSMVFWREPMKLSSCFLTVSDFFPKSLSIFFVMALIAAWISFPLISCYSSSVFIGTPARIFFIKLMNLSVSISWSLISPNALKSSSLLPVLSSICSRILMKTASRLPLTSLITLKTYCSNSSYLARIVFWLSLMDYWIDLESILTGVIWFKYFFALLMTSLRGFILWPQCSSL